MMATEQKGGALEGGLGAEGAVERARGFGVGRERLGRESGRGRRAAGEARMRRQKILARLPQMLVHIPHLKKPQEL